MKTITTFAALFAAILSFNASAAVPQTGRVDFSDGKNGLERQSEVKYNTGRIAPEGTKGLWSHSGRHVSNGRQG